MSTYKILKGDVTNPTVKDNEVILIPHVCNDIGLFGAGVAEAIAERWQHVRQDYLNYYNDNKDNPEKLLGNIASPYGKYFSTAGKNIFVANMIAQHGVVSKDNPTPIQYDHLKKCIRKIEEIISTTKKEKPDLCFKICAPKFGSGLAGGNWNIIEYMIKTNWVEKGIQVEIYEIDN